ncbi:MAG: hypothetical protein JNK56_22500 [Myxococcales bacterium]|nr:hypothetical protein [Myxococcales bacterium]
MRIPSAPHVIALWEAALQARRGEAGLALLRCADGRADDELVSLPIGRRDRLLYELRARLLGPALHLRAACPRCGELVEAELDALPAPPPTPEIHRIRVGERVLQFRLPSAADVAAASDSPDPQRTLLARCLEPPADLDDTLADAVLTAMAEQDPDADLRLGLSCPACAHEWPATLDIESFFRAELGAWARRFALEVDALARTYHWAEADILAMSPARRQLYLDRVTG